MSTITPAHLLYSMAIALFLLGAATFIAGILILTLRAFGKDVHILANQATQLAQKGIAEDISGLVGNLSTLLDSVNDLMRTTAGIGFLLIALGIILMAGASILALQTLRMLS